MELRVFLVEDLQSVRDLMADLFATIGGFRVVGSAGTEAEAKLWLDMHRGEWDIAIIDLVLDQGSGLGVLHRAMLDPNSGKVVVFSSYASAGIRQYCLAVGADAVFDKKQTEAFVTWLHQQRLGKPAPSA